MVSMKDIAKELNLSRCTVSDILNNKTNKKSYKQETIDLVLHTAKEMGYVTNNIAKSLKTGSTRTVALVIPDISNSFYTHIIKEVECMAYAANYSLIICITEESLEKENEVLRMLSSRMVDGILISAVSASHSLQDNYPFKIVCFDRTVENKNYCSVTIDNETAACELGQHFVRAGARNPLFIATSSTDYTVRLRVKGFQKAFQEAGIEWDEHNVLYDVYNAETACNSLIKIIEKHSIAFDSIALSTNYYIYGVLKAIKQTNQELTALGGFENFNGSEFFDDVICVYQPEKEIASIAFQSLLTLMNQEHSASKVLNAYIP